MLSKQDIADVNELVVHLLINKNVHTNQQLINFQF